MLNLAISLRIIEEESQVYAYFSANCCDFGDVLASSRVILALPPEPKYRHPSVDIPETDDKKGRQPLLAAAPD
jgi:hypothetical protein